MIVFSLDFWRLNYSAFLQQVFLLFLIICRIACSNLIRAHLEMLLTWHWNICSQVYRMLCLILACVTKDFIVRSWLSTWDHLYLSVLDPKIWAKFNFMIVLFLTFWKLELPSCSFYVKVNIRNSNFYVTHLLITVHQKSSKFGIDSVFFIKLGLSCMQKM